MSETTAPGGVGPGAGLARILSDDRLVQRAVKGDDRAFTAIFGRYHQALYRYCLAIVGDVQDAQDALQNAMLKVLRALPGEERQIDLKPWLYRIAHNESVELLRRRRDTLQLDAELVAPGPGPAGEAASRERLARLISDLDELPERQRGALVMRELAGLEFAEIGAALGTSSAVARQTIYEARLSLRKMDEGRDMSCEAVTKALSDGDGRVTRRGDIRAHLRACADCRRFRGEIESRQRDLAALAPLPAVAVTGILQGLLGGEGAGTGGLASALGGGAAKSLGASAAFKATATVAIVAAIGVGVADRGGLVHIGPSKGHDSQPARVGRPVDVDPAHVRLTEPAGGNAMAGRRSAVAVAKAARHIGASRPTTAGTAKGPDGVQAGAKATPTPGAHGASITHPHGKGHEKQLPETSAQGPQTAAAHKAVNHGSAASQGHPMHPFPSTHPAHPTDPSLEKGPSSSGAGSATEASPQAGAGGEASSGKEAGKKP